MIISLRHSISFYKPNTCLICSFSWLITGWTRFVIRNRPEIRPLSRDPIIMPAYLLTTLLNPSREDHFAQSDLVKRWRHVPCPHLIHIVTKRYLWSFSSRNHQDVLVNHNNVNSAYRVVCTRSINSFWPVTQHLMRIMMN